MAEWFHVTACKAVDTGSIPVTTSKDRRKVIVADDYQKAWNNYRDDGVIKTLPEPDYVFDVVNNDVEKVFVFRDTGCC